MNNITRRQAVVLLAGTTLLEATPEDLHETEREGDGPFYKPGAPERSNLLEPGISGTPFRLTGRVRNVDAQPVPGAVIDIWHADDRGEYDNQGWKLRGRARCDAQGAFEIRTTQPKFYNAGSTTRSAHFHIKVSGAGAQLLTTALYFEDDPYITRDRMVQTPLVLAVRKSRGGRAASFDFVLRKSV